MRCGLSLRQLGGGLSYCSLLAFLRNLPPSSAYMREKHGERAMWMTDAYTNRALADVFDLLSMLRSEHAAAHGVELEPVAYPRPGEDGGGEYETMSRDEFDDWMRGFANV